MHTEDRMTALPYRRRLISETENYIEKLRIDCNIRREEYFKPDFTSASAYSDSVTKYRNDLIGMLGRPLSEYPSTVPTNCEKLYVDDDEYGKIDRIWIECAPGLFSYGLLYTPYGDSPYPLVVALHGGMGTPEIVSSFFNSANYNDMVIHIREKIRAAVYVPQLLLWSGEYNEKPEDAAEHLSYNNSLRQCGGSVAGLEIFKIMRSVDYLLANLKTEKGRLGICGLSYGGFYSLFTAACDPRFNVTLSSCFFNDRYIHSWQDWVWFDSASKMLDSEIAGIVCPRTLCIQLGESDELFDCNIAKPLIAEVREAYKKIGKENFIRFSIAPGGHQFTPDNGDLDFFIANL